MKILALNTAFIEADLVLGVGDKYTCKKFDSSCKHSESVMIGIDEILAGIKIGELDCMAVVVGTGSFTGIRIGISIAEGFKTAYPNLKLVEINSFELVVNQLETLPQERFAVVLNALGGRYFVQYFLGKQAVSEQLLTQTIDDVEKIGVKSEDLEICDKYVEFTPENLMKVAKQKALNQEFVEYLNPLYIRQAQAEENLNRKDSK